MMCNGEKVPFDEPAFLQALMAYYLMANEDTKIPEVL